MTLFSISDFFAILKKYFVRILALSLAVSALTMLVTDKLQTYTATLYFKYNHDDAVQNLAPDGYSKLDPYEIQNPVVIQGAIDQLFEGEKEKSNVEDVRQNISVTKVVPKLENEIEESAALLGEKYDVITTEYQIQYKYKAEKGEEFGAKMFSAMMKEYDDFLLNKYYNKKTIVDFTKTLTDTSADYIEIANVMSTNIQSNIDYFNDMAGGDSVYRSNRTGYSFSDLASLYQNLYNIQYAKYYGNVRAGNLAKDRETVIKSYQAKVKDLSESMEINEGVAEGFKQEIVTFYDPYKEEGLYLQAQNMQTNLNNTNNRDADVLDDRLIRDFINTYDEIVVSYTDYAMQASNNRRTIEYYNKIITSFQNDNVADSTKQKLLSLNEEIFDEICVLSAYYSQIANETIDEYLDTLVTVDLQYLITPEVVADKPVKLFAVLAFVLSFGVILICIIIYRLSKGNIKDLDKYAEHEEKRVVLDEEGLSEMQKAIYEQYNCGFDQFYLVYQPIVECQSGETVHYEAFIRWKSPTLGTVSPARVIENVSQMGLFKPLNEWILRNVCDNIKKRIEKGEKAPVVHVNCPHFEISGFALNSILIKLITEYEIPAGCLCLELDGNHMTNSMEDISLLSEMGIKISVDRFENTDEQTEVIQVLCPDYIKMSLDSLNFDMLATSGEDMAIAAMEMFKYYSDIIEKCDKFGVSVCICGIENAVQDKAISKLKFKYKQGYFYGKPVRYE